VKIFLIYYFKNSSRNYDDQTIRITQRACNQNNYVIYLTDDSPFNSTVKKTTKRETGIFDQTNNQQQNHKKGRKRKNRHKTNKFGVYQRNEVNNRIELFRGEKFPHKVVSLFIKVCIIMIGKILKIKNTNGKKINNENFDCRVFFVFIAFLYLIV
jgi:hypothetical protein